MPGSMNISRKNYPNIISISCTVVGLELVTPIIVSSSGTTNN